MISKQARIRQATSRKVTGYQTRNQSTVEKYHLNADLRKSALKGTIQKSLLGFWPAVICLGMVLLGQLQAGAATKFLEPGTDATYDFLVRIF